jgi:hypothetical protein
MAKVAELLAEASLLAAQEYDHLKVLVLVLSLAKLKSIIFFKDFRGCLNHQLEALKAMY